jgi:pimeloyl-ACP methyl ester carboxylesterase
VLVVHGWRRIGVVLVAVVASGSCVEPPPPNAGPPLTGVDFPRLRKLGNFALDLTDFQTGLLSEERLYGRMVAAGYHVTLVECTAAAMNCVILRDAAAGETVIVLPGTSNLENLWSAMQVALEPNAALAVRVHAGFDETAALVYDALRTRLAPDERVTLVGYSLGGAAAVLLAPRLEQDGRAVDEVITLGQPAITDNDGAAVLARLPILRIIAGNDPIPHARGENEDRAQFGRALILLDGPYVVTLPASSPNLDSATRLAIARNTNAIIDHLTYRVRLASKVPGDVHSVDLIQRDAYLEAPAAP